MLLCESCFQARSWRNHNPSYPSSGTGRCVFGHFGELYDIGRWGEELYRLMRSYERTIGGSGRTLAQLIHEDWKIFSLDDPAVSRVLQDVNGASEFASTEQQEIWVPVGFGGTLDYVTRWQDFVREIQQFNRYHPLQTPDKEVLWDAADSCARTLNVGDTWLRARPTQPSTWLTQSEMGPPPPEKAGAGRANPAGIPYLYLGDTEQTCVAEIRAGKYDVIALGKFVVEDNLTVVDLTHLQQPDFFDDSAQSRVWTHRLLRELSKALQRPNTDKPYDLTYTPTQYLCELLKQGPSAQAMYDGVLYPSSMNSGGKNLVLFGDHKMSCTEVRHRKVSDIAFTLHDAQAGDHRAA